MPRRSTPTSTSSTACLPPAASAATTDRPLPQQEPGGQGAARRTGKTRISRDHRRHEQHGRRSSSAPAATSGSSASICEGQYPRRPRAGARGRSERARHRLLAVGRPGQCLRDLRPAQQPGPADERGRALADDRRRRPGNQAGPNEEPYSFHPGGVNALFGDGSVRFIKNSVNLVTFRSLLTLNGGETISADSYRLATDFSIRPEASGTRADLFFLSGMPRCPSHAIRCYHQLEAGSPSLSRFDRLDVGCVHGLTGCGKSDSLPALTVFPVNGKVLRADGKALTGGHIYLVSKAGDLPVTPSGEIGPDGTFSVTTGGSGEGRRRGNTRSESRGNRLRPLERLVNHRSRSDTTTRTVRAC